MILTKNDEELSLNLTASEREYYKETLLKILTKKYVESVQKETVFTISHKQLFDEALPRLKEEEHKIALFYYTTLLIQNIDENTSKVLSDLQERAANYFKLIMDSKEEAFKTSTEVHSIYRILCFLEGFHKK